jgi:toxin ParE1/3/4
MVPEFEENNIRELIRGNYRIVYKIIHDYRIDILTVNNCQRLPRYSSLFNEE